MQQEHSRGGGTAAAADFCSAAALKLTRSVPRLQYSITSHVSISAEHFGLHSSASALSSSDHDAAVLHPPVSGNNAIMSMAALIGTAAGALSHSNRCNSMCILEQSAHYRQKRRRMR
jgi:hypothetical protein